jgi:voltage-gated potassium channel
MDDSNGSKTGLRRFDWLILYLSFYVLVELYLELILQYPDWMVTATHAVDFAICIVFLGDFFWRWRIADRKLQFLKWNWLDFVSSIPMVGILRIARAARILRLLRVFRSGKIFYTFLNKHESVSTFQTVAAFTVIAILMGGLAMFRIEQDVTPYFESFGNSLWWSLLTTTTLGFAQDVVPRTVEGKVVSMVLIGAGIILVGTFTGMVADYFISDEDISDRLSRIEKRLADMEGKMDELLRRLPKV